MNENTLPCVGFASSLGARTTGSDGAPLFLKEHVKLSMLDWKSIVSTFSDAHDKNVALAQGCEEFASEVLRLTKEAPFFFAFGGDHSIAMSTWSAVSEGMRERGDLGLIWLDAHMDSHTPETTESGFIHGMPLAALLGHGDERFTQLLSKKPKVKPENVILIGVRDFEPQEYEFLRSLNVKIYFIEEVHERGLTAVLQESIAALAERTAGYGVSFDIDVVDPSVVKATGTPIPNGIDAKEAIAAMEVIAANPPVAFELVEYNPYLDKDGETLKFINQLLKTLVESNNCALLSQTTAPLSAIS